MKNTEVCKECGCAYKSKYMIRVDYDTSTENKSKAHWEATSKKSLVGWLKFICNEFGDFQEIQIYNLLTECRGHEKYYKNLQKRNKKLSRLKRQ